MRGIKSLLTSCNLPEFQLLLLIENAMLKTGIIIQARSGSKRLPQKMTKTFFEGENILSILLKRLRQFTPSDIEVVLATTVNQSDDTLEEIAATSGVKVFRGSEENVLSRFVQVAEKFGFDRVIRICGDNPFFDIEGTLRLADSDPFGEFDYVSYRMADGRPTILSHLGFWGEVVSKKALKDAFASTIEKRYLEHVTNYIYTHPEMFRIKLIDAPFELGKREDIRLTVDTEADFELSQNLFLQLDKKNTGFRADQIVRYIDRFPEIKQQMKDQIEFNKK